MSMRTKQFYAFGPFRFDSEKRVLVRDGKPVPVAPKTAEILLVLVEHAGHLVDKDDLMKRVWPDAFVEEGNLNKNVSVLRKVLGEWEGGQEYIETVPKRGYRFVAPVFEVTHAEGGYKPQNSAQASLTGKKVSHYRILEPLGGGGMGVVYRAEDLKLGRHVALKFLPEELAIDPVALGRFEREARAASALDHPNICAIYEFGEHEHQPFIVMQHLEGETLRERMAGPDGLPGHSEGDGGKTLSLTPPFTLNELLDLATQIVDGIEAAHQKGIIHRDIKPANIFITHRGEVKILDFGVAKLLDADEQVPSSAEQDGGNADISGAATHPVNLTRTGTAMGTASYMSPEQVRGEKLDRRTDLFSFGLVLYEMATGQRAFAGDTEAVIHEAILRRTALPARQLNPKLPPKLEEIIGKALEKDREARYQSASEILADLKRLNRDRPADRSWRMVAAGLLVVVVIAGVIFLFAKGHTSPPTEVKLRQLTTNSSEDPVRTGAISPDGKLLAYADLRGIHIKVLETGDNRIVPQPEAFKGSRVDWYIVQWFPDSLRFVANLIPPPDNHFSQKHTSIWTVSVLGGEPRKIHDDADAWSVSPDGSLVTFGAGPGTFGNREIWVMGPNGEHARKLFETDQKSSIGVATWSSDGHRLAYLRTDKSGESVESRDLKSGLPTTMLTDRNDRLASGLWLPDGRLIYALHESDKSRTCNFWQMRIDTRTGEPLDKPTRLTNWVGFCLDIQGVTADSKRLAFLEWASDESAYVATLEADGTRIDSPERLTLSENRAHPGAWTADSKEVIFIARRDERWGIFRQSIEDNTAEPIVASLEGYPKVPNEDRTELPRTSPDGALVLYRVFAPESDPSPTRVHLMRVPVKGGIPELVMAANFYGPPSCARAPATLCALAERSQDLRQIIFTALDPLKGRGRELTRFDTDAKGSYGWSLSPDSSSIAVLNKQEGRIHILSLNKGAQREFAVQGWDGLDDLSWAANGKSLFVSSLTQYGSVLLNVDLRGDSHVLWKQEGGLGTFGIPSPDGRHLAMLGWTLNSNIWMMENF